MALEKMTGANGLNPSTQPIESLQRGPQGQGVAKSSGGLDFKRTLDQLNSQGLTGTSTQGANAQGVNAPEVAHGARQLKFSNHAVERMHSRGISIAPDEMKNIESAIQRAAQKGSKDTLVLAGDKALIVSVKNNTVVTIMDRAAMKENVFTNIDSTVVV